MESTLYKVTLSEIKRDEYCYFYSPTSGRWVELKKQYFNFAIDTKTNELDEYLPTLKVYKGRLHLRKDDSII